MPGKFKKSYDVIDTQMNNL